MKCIVPDEQGILCGENSIKSHSIQHNGILSRLVEDGIVYCLGERTKGEEIFEYDLKDKGILKKHLFLNAFARNMMIFYLQILKKEHFVRNRNNVFNML